MSRYISYINTAARILEIYKGEIPLSVFLKKYFAENKKYGSKDRKQIGALCYNYFRLGCSSKNISINERILLGTFLSETTPNELMEALRPEWNNQITLPFREKTALVKSQFSLTNVFPFQNELSNDIEFEAFCKSFFIRPSLFLRIRPEMNALVFKKLEQFSTEYSLVGTDCIELPNSTKADDFFELDKQVVVQDYSSQRVLNYFKLTPIANIKAWDCCAASGGKSILLFDRVNGKVNLTVSDIRSSILSNLHTRFAKAGIKNYHSFVADLSNGNWQSKDKMQEGSMSVILCDVPCTGSGTWSRTPEQLYFFNQQTIETFSDQQKRIVSNAIPFLEKDGLLVYSTCSVFKKENETVVNFIKEKFHLQLLHMEALTGYDKRADTLFVAILQK